MHWDDESDNFIVKVKVDVKSPTRRGVLSTGSQLYDPFGFLQPFILPVKILLQQMTKQDLG